MLSLTQPAPLTAKCIFPEYARNYGSGEIVEKEPWIADLPLIRHKISDRERPDNPYKTLIYASFAEFGSEFIPLLYTFPQVIERYPDFYRIVVGWHSRKYLYQHLVDEYWELPREYSWLREYARAYHHDSRNLKTLESVLSKQGRLFTSAELGNATSRCACRTCFRSWQSLRRYPKCPYCQSDAVKQSLISNPLNAKRSATWIPAPDKEKTKSVTDLLGPMPVAIFQRSRKCYGRNLSVEFYASLAELIRSMGYDPVILGEPGFAKEIPGCVNMTTDPRMDDIEYTFAIVKQCLFTIQFWTASTRIAGLQAVPYILFESPDQIWGKMEQLRRMMCDRGPSKVIASDYCLTRDNPKDTLEIVESSIKRLVAGDYSDVIGLVSSIENTEYQKRNFKSKL